MERQEMMYTIVSGNPIDGLNHECLFADFDQATAYAEEHNDTTEWWIATIDLTTDSYETDFYANWTPSEVMKMHLALGQAKDDLGDANAKIRRLEAMEDELNATIRRMVNTHHDLQERVSILYSNIANREAELEEARLALDSISNITHATLGSCNIYPEAE